MRFARPLFRLLRRGFGLVGFAITFIGLAGLPENLATWQSWIDRVMSDPLVLALAERAVRVAEVVNLLPVRAALVAFGLLMIVWPVRWFWRIRHKLIFRWRRLVSENVWISRTEALKVIRESQWGRIKAPINVSSGLRLLGRMGSGGYDDETQKQVKFAAYVKLTLDKFCESNPKHCRTQESESQVDEVPLRRFLNLALEKELASEFGEIPNFRIS